MKKDLHPIPEDEIEGHTFQGIVGKSDAILEVRSKIEELAPIKRTVLITGETGVGKDLVAKALRKLRDPDDKEPYISFNCGRLNTSTPYESQLFGHEIGAFTGADSQHIGYFERAKSGTLFLDEIAEMPPKIQPSFLTVLEGKPFTRMGGKIDIYPNARLIAATNVDLAEAFRAGKFRDDLIYRLNQFGIDIAPLRDRRGDIPLLVHRFIYDLSCEYKKKIIGIEQDALDFLEERDWPGNVRQLRTVIDNAVVFAKTDRLEIEGIEKAHEGSDLLSKTDVSQSSDHRVWVFDMKAVFPRVLVFDTQGDSQNQGSQVDVESFRPAFEDFIRNLTAEPSTTTQDAALSTPSSEWVEAFKKLLENEVDIKELNTEDYERPIHTFVALIEAIEDGSLKINHLSRRKEELPPYKTPNGEVRQYAPKQELQRMYEKTIHEILKPIFKENPALLKDSDSKDSDSDEVKLNVNKTAIKQLRSVLLHKNPQLKKANDAIENENATQSPPSVR